MYLNKIMVLGNLTRDPEIKALPSGSNVCAFSIATNRSWKDTSGAKKEQTEFHSIVAFGKTADTIAQWLKKGSTAYVEGRLQTRTWDGQDGAKHYRTEIVAENVQFGPRKASSEPTEAPSPSDQGEAIDSDEIPF